MSSIDRLPDIGVINLADLQRKTSAYPSYFGGTMPYGFDDSTFSFPGMFNPGTMTTPYCPPSQPTLTPSAQQAQAQLAAKYSANSATAAAANRASGDDLAQIRANQKAAVKAVQTKQNEQHNVENNQNDGIDAKTGKPIDKSVSRIASKAGKGIVDMLNPLNWFSEKDANGKRKFSWGKTLTTLGTIALVVGAEILTAGAATPFIAGAFVALGAVQTAQGVTQACNAKTQEEFDNGCSNAGSGVASMGLSVIGVRGGKVFKTASTRADAAEAANLAKINAGKLKSSNPDLADAIITQADKVSKASAKGSTKTLAREMKRLNFLVDPEKAAAATAAESSKNEALVTKLSDLLDRLDKLPKEHNGGNKTALRNIIKKVKESEGEFTPADLEQEAARLTQANGKGNSYPGLAQHLLDVSEEMQMGFIARRTNAAKTAVSKGVSGIKNARTTLRNAVTDIANNPIAKHPVAATEIAVGNWGIIGNTSYLVDANHEHELQAQAEAEEAQRQEAAKPFEQQAQDDLTDKAQSAIANYGINPDAIQSIMDKDDKKVTVEMKEAEIKKLVEQKRTPLIDEFVQWGGQRNVIDKTTDLKAMASMVDQQRNQYVQYASTHGLLKDGMSAQQVMDAVKRSQDEEAERLRKCQNNFFTMPSAI